MMRHAISPVFRAIALIGALLLTGGVAQTASAEKYASIVIDADTHEVLHARNADEARYPASLTKVMTLYMLFDALKAGEVSMDENLVISRHAASQPPSNLRLRSGSTIRVRDAIGALVNKSANDVAVVVAERLGGTESRFAQLMTVKAKSLGLDNTRFMNASGLPDTQQMTTARDLVVLAEAMLEDHADYYHYFSNTSFRWGGRSYKNHNELLGKVEGVDGIKTGYTRASGFNLMASAKRDGRRVIAIMLGGNTAKSRNAHVEDLVEAAFASLTSPEHNANPEEQNRLVFASVLTPVHPNAAAEPMLNGKRLSVIIAEGGSDDEDDPISNTPAVAEVEAPDLVAPEVAVAEVQSDITQAAAAITESGADQAETTPDVLPSDSVVAETDTGIVSEPSDEPQTMSFAEYELQQADILMAETKPGIAAEAPTMSFSEYELQQMQLAR